MTAMPPWDLVDVREFVAYSRFDLFIVPLVIVIKVGAHRIFETLLHRSTAFGAGIMTSRRVSTWSCRRSCSQGRVARGPSLRPRTGDSSRPTHRSPVCPVPAIRNSRHPGSAGPTFGSLTRQLGGDARRDALAIVTLFGDTPRALAVSPDGSTVYAAVFRSGSQTTTLGEGARNGFASAGPVPPWAG